MAQADSTSPNSRRRRSASNAAPSWRTCVRERWSTKCRRTPSTCTGAASSSLARPRSVSTASVTRRSAALGFPRHVPRLDQAVEPAGEPTRRQVEAGGQVAHPQLLVGRLREVHEHAVVAAVDAEACRSGRPRARRAARRRPPPARARPASPRRRASRGSVSSATSPGYVPPVHGQLLTSNKWEYLRAQSSWTS